MQITKILSRILDESWKSISILAFNYHGIERKEIYFLLLKFGDESNVDLTTDYSGLW